MTTKDDGVMRSFDTGATRDTAEGKLDFEGFVHPLFLEQFAKYMNMHRLQSDGTLRDSDNWQKGIPQDICMKSLFRHFFEMWKLHRNGIYNREQYRDFMAGAMGIIFNVQAYVLQDLQDLQGEDLGLVDFDGDEPTDEMEERQAKINEAKRQAVKKEVKEEYRSALTDIINDIHESGDAPCECCPGDCDCGSTGRIYGFAMPTDIYVDGDREDDWKITTEAPRYCTESLLDVEDGWDCDCDLCLAENGDEDAKERLKEDVQVGEVPLPDWVPSEEPKNFDSLPGAMQALVDAVGEDNVTGIRVETNEVDRMCTTCRFAARSFTEHPCDCCDEDHSNFSKK
jgi:hypothetical protein